MARFIRSNRLLRVTAGRYGLLATFLNEPISGLEHARVVEIFHYCQQLESLDPTSRTAGNTRRAINAHCGELRITPFRQADGWDWRAPHPGQLTGVSPAYALKLIADLDSSGLLSRLRQCDACTNWFFATSGKKLVCSNACRSEKFKQANPQAYRQKRKEDMRKYRASKKRIARAKARKRSPSV